MIHWKVIDEYVEPNWVKDGTEMPPWLFWRKSKALGSRLHPGRRGFRLEVGLRLRRQQGDALFRGQRARQQRGEHGELQGRPERRDEEPLEPSARRCSARRWCAIV